MTPCHVTAGTYLQLIHIASRAPRLPLSRLRRAQIRPHTERDRRSIVQLEHAVGAALGGGAGGAVGIGDGGLHALDAAVAEKLHEPEEEVGADLA